MQNVIVEKPYCFVPPKRGTFWPWLFQKLRIYEPHLRRREGVIAHECRHVERLRESLAAGHGILLAPNHCRTSDPVVLGFLAREADTYLYCMASWHLFHENWLTAWTIPRMGAFSVNREGIDRQAINTAMDILERAERPLVLFPEGAASRNNDRLHALLDISFLARGAAKKRAKRVAGGRVVIHPVALKYVFGGDIERQGDEVLTRIEERLSWRPQRQLPLLDRVAKVGRALLSLKEIEHFGRTQTGPMAARLDGLIDRLLCPLEQEWLGTPRSGPVVPRIKALRIKILPDMIEGRVDATERQRRWDQLADMYLAQQVSYYPPNYFDEYPSIDRLMELIERFEEDLTDRATVHGSLTVIIEVGEAIQVGPARDRSAEIDPLMRQLEESLQGMLDRLARESPEYRPRLAG
jgi:1-acyl-sn-glycerol-3-phosphate acyltransferase